MHVIQTRFVSLGLALALPLWIFAQACSEDPQKPEGQDAGPSHQNPPGSDPAEKPEALLLGQLADQVITPSVKSFHASVEALDAAVEAHQGDDVSAIKTAFVSSMAAWQRLLLMQLGPAGASGSRLGGKDLGKAIYSWPDANPCRIDQELAKNAFDGKPDFLDGQLALVFGLDAFEYLLYYTGSENHCAPNFKPNSDGSWKAMSSDDLKSRRFALLKLVSARLKKDSQTLWEAWDPAKGNFGKHLKTAGQAGSVYPSERDALNDVMAALFYLDLESKDRKLAIPAGMTSSCSGDACLDRLESRWAKIGKANLLGNLQGFIQMMEGNLEGKAGEGFMKRLETAKHGSLGTAMLADAKATITALEALPDDLSSAVSSHPEQLKAAYQAIKKVTDKLKGDFATVLSLELPQEGAGDSD